MAHKESYILPPNIVTPVDVGRLVQELESVDEAIHQLKLRHDGAIIKLPKTSGLMDQLISPNGLNLLHDNERTAMLTFLHAIRDKAPVVHMSFSADPTPAFLEKITIWLRKEVDPFVLIKVGLQPNIGVGCVLRTTNHYFDLSLKQSFAGSVDKLKEVMQPIAPVQTAEEVN
jgi:hypothetical protein